ncbi:glycosyltransferase [Clostridium sp. AF17-2]|jgi:glycosyltransferase involved in cell wall biosynthesis|uniref:glycosyltransferase family 4 protein n=1 Tax=unclassified Clostridium TaxID=2614128 RepID=UPI000E548543|nr:MULTISPECIES: glycosyltransferase family 4 protein [unclassified Clostridium]RGG76796.1 glycosyltransferase [Clostridium sp. AF17-21AC]RHR56799.1 glycosyltransferase [Clostridium sp. AF17-2]
MVKSKKILFVMPRLPFPATSGRKTSLYHYCRILSEELGYKLIVAAFLEKEDNPNLKPKFIDRMEILPKPASITKIKNILIDSVILKRKPMQVSLYWNPEAKKIIDMLVDEEKPDIIIGDMVRSTEYIRDYNAFRIADLDDRISLRYQRQLDYDITGINPYGAFLNTLPKMIQKIMLWKPLKVYVVKNEINLLRRYELEISEQCDKTIFVAQQEADILNKELHKNKACAVPIGVDVDYFSLRYKNSEEGKIAFLGALGVAHNEFAVRYFIKEILPLILFEYPKAKFLVVGGGASEDLLKLQSEYVIFTGRVEDVRDYLEECSVFVCPMTFGSGIKTKNLEAMAMGLPVVTTSIGAENINARNERDWIVADSSEKFAKAILEILVNENKRLSLSKNGSIFVREHFTWKVAKEKFAEIFGEIQ